MEVIGWFASGIVHDFNNLVTVIKGYSELILCHLRQSDPLYEAAEEIKKASEKASTLTRQLLAFCRRQDIVPQILNLNTVVANVEQMLQRLIGNHIKLSTVLEPDLGYIYADAGQIEQILLHLAINACDAMPRGGQLTIETANMTMYVKLTISDTGYGLQAERFTPPSQPAVVTRKQQEWPGQGLSAVHDIVKRSGGMIWVASKPAQGTILEIYLPQVPQTNRLGRSIPLPSG
jgi:signal transduction histidine kinase